MVASVNKQIRPEEAMMDRQAVLVFLALNAVVASGVIILTGFPFWWTFAICVGAMFVNGIIATIEDDLPGGFNNPDGRADTFSPGAQRAMKIVGWARWAGAVLLLFLAFAVSAAVIKGTFGVALGVGLSVSMTLLAAAALWRSRLALWGSALSLLLGLALAMATR